MTFRKNLVSMAVAVGIAVPGLALATNGMNLEAYGPIAGGMGGASMAYDNGTAAMMNNPATLGLMAPGSKRLDAALGFLGPDVTASMPGMASAKSKADAFFMPAVGWAAKGSSLTYGVGVFAQGGMGTEYAKDSFLTAGSNELVRSEVGVGRLMIPVAYSVSDKIEIAGSLDYVWASMDIKMAMSGSDFGDMIADMGGSQAAGSASGSMVTGFGGMVSAGMMQAPSPTGGPVNWARFDFSNNSDFMGEAFGSGMAGKLGLTFKVNSRLSLGASYHSKTALGDLTTSNATVTMNANVDDNILNGTWDGKSIGSAAGTYTAVGIPVKGEIKVRDFQWPDTFGFGAAFQATDKLMIAGDIKRINWSGVMKSFKMTFTPSSDNTGLAAGFAGTTMDVELLQKWKDQTVIALGATYQATDKLALRAGFNTASNPVPDQYLNPLFPAIVERHFTFGGGYAFSQASAVNASVTVASENTATGGNGIKNAHSQVNWQLMYSYTY